MLGKSLRPKRESRKSERGLARLCLGVLNCLIQSDLTWLYHDCSGRAYDSLTHDESPDNKSAGRGNPTYSIQIGYTVLSALNTVHHDICASSASSKT